jgi:hypothetical protein
MAAENHTWGEELIANELKLKLGIRVSPRTVRKYLASYRDRTPDPSQRWLTFVHNHAQAIVACDFFVVFTARFRILYVFVSADEPSSSSPSGGIRSSKQGSARRMAPRVLAGKGGAA